MTKTDIKTKTRERRHTKVRFSVSGTKEKPRLSVYRSNKYIHAQIIDDENSRTLVGLTSKVISGKNKTETATIAGKKIAEEAKEKKITKVVFDRGGFVYAGRIKAFADGAREGGLEF
ncbi:MAG: large subunit ribosomal protein L18 [Parcubacteria group bacterium Gr01-1014_48]|nr:MAG: large subunit ribosomal protein L18 [Parcubacteria group bacterium Greene0416_14]TSC72528.1 MAG: large subunit ribosomal protein L18 [Parcubacteria group bacterium Gr01-1014_48]TSD00582.1 MAG: large subunit ribosomal protein L18 [Parcubacteria group bacterium Greene1014_15]TSD08273.1 MAG: large subunit ribosomal protein L18 [Parcubacteria group bacterium Greene0714_4]